MRIHWALTVVGVLSVLALGPALAGTMTLDGSGALALQIAANGPIAKTPTGAGVRGEITVTTADEVKPGLTTTFFVDETARFASSYSRPELRVDTTRLPDGLHQLRVEVSDGARLVMSTGGIPLHIMNQVPAAAMQQARPVEMGLNKVYRKILLREIVWFDNHEADLEKHAFRDHGLVYITLTDLARHVGGSIVWGPEASFIQVERGGTKLRVIPGSARVIVDGRPRSLGGPAVQIENRTFVPVRPMLKLLGLNSEWNSGNGRLYVEVNRR
jgi:hypothetical protein